MSMEGVWIIGDVHGCYKTLKKLIDKLPYSKNKLCFVGDLIDRGTDSQKVVEFVRKNNHLCVYGNHEEAMMEDGAEIIQNPSLVIAKRWTNHKYNYGGMETLASYDKLGKTAGTIIQEKIFKEDIEWMENLPLYLEFKNIKNKDGRHLVVSHSSVSEYWKYRDNSKSDPDYKSFWNACLYSRTKNPADNSEIFNIFGHTPVEKIEMANHFANIDTGAFIKEDIKYGKLTALHFPTMEIAQQENIE